MDHIDNVFTNACLPGSANDPAIRAAIEVAKRTLNRYYTLTDLSELYRIAMGEFGRTPTMHINLSSNTMQYFTLVTNWHTSRQLDGTRTGSTPLKTSFVNSSTRDILHRQDSDSEPMTCRMQTILRTPHESNHRCVLKPPALVAYHPIDYMLQQAAAPRNIFDNLPTLAPICSATTIDELTLYLSTGPENVTNALQWWQGKRKTYPQLSRMALDYLTVPG